MDPILHALIATGCMAGCYYVGRRFAAKSMFDPIISKMLDKLEEDGYIYTTVGKDGDKELILISDIIAKTLRDSVKSTK
jgi:hypothetical protein